MVASAARPLRKRRHPHEKHPRVVPAIGSALRPACLPVGAPSPCLEVGSSAEAERRDENYRRGYEAGLATSDPLIVHRGEAVHRASSHRDGGPKTALNVTNTAARPNKSIRTTSAIFVRFCFVVMFAPLTKRTLALTIVDPCPCTCAISHRAFKIEAPRRIAPSARDRAAQPLGRRERILQRTLPRRGSVQASAAR